MNNNKIQTAYKFNTIRNNQGTTMLETLLAFTVLLIIMAVLFNVIAFCSELHMNAKDTATIMEKFNTEIYNSQNRITPESSSPGVETISTNSSELIIKKYTTSSNNQSPLFYLELNTVKTSGENIGSGAIGTKPLSLSQIEATTYAYKGSESNVIPKALVFSHK